MSDARFRLVGARELPPPINLPRKRGASFGTIISAALLGLILLGCFGAGLFFQGDAGYMDLLNCSVAPCRAFPFGTDALGRDLFHMIWAGGRVSLTIGFLSTLIAGACAIVFGSASGLAPARVDALMMRFTEILLSVPSLLLVILLQAALGRASALTISVVIGLTSWTGMAKVVRTEVVRLRSSEYVLASRLMGGGFGHLLRAHLAPNFVSSIMFMLVMSVRSAIIAESTLSFMGIGLPVETISWGSILSLSEKALLSRAWWLILIPGAFLIAALMCVTALGNALRKRLNRAQRKL